MEADATQLHQVLLNLAINARDAMPDGGTLTFAAENVTLTEPRTFLGESIDPGRYIRLLTTDTGTGIPADRIGRIFEPFFTSKTQGQGTGLGLPTSLGIVRSHHGLIEVSSKPGAGTVFTVLLPAAETNEADSAPAPASPPAATMKRSCWSTMKPRSSWSPARSSSRTDIRSSRRP
ncbi:MAG: ATP-binding protein, partial [Limisphaerales bacterium]